MAVDPTVVIDVNGALSVAWKHGVKTGVVAALSAKGCKDDEIMERLHDIMNMVVNPYTDED